MKIIIHCANQDSCGDGFIPVEGRTLYCSAEEEVRKDAERLFSDYRACLETDALREIQGIPEDGSSLLRRIWWWLCWFFELGDLPEYGSSTVKRLESFLQVILAQADDCVISAKPYILRVLLRVLERHGFSALRGHSGSIRPGERIRVTEKAAHCGGCRHNCLLANPGCGVGRDKASRGY